MCMLMYSHVYMYDCMLMHITKHIGEIVSVYQCISYVYQGILASVSGYIYIYRERDKYGMIYLFMFTLGAYRDSHRRGASV